MRQDTAVSEDDVGKLGLLKKYFLSIKQKLLLLLLLPKYCFSLTA